jgi:hypothetical protein
LGPREEFKTELSHLTGGGADKTWLQMKGKQLPPGENNSSDHPAQAGSLTAPHNSN